MDIRIQNLRKAKGISQEELADKVGVSRQAVSKWESGQSLPEIDKIILMSEFFNVTTDYLLKGTEAPASQKESTNAFIFVAAATFMNFLGLLVSWMIWFEEQNPAALVVGLILIAVGCMVFAIGQSVSNKNLVKAKRVFWVVNIWIICFPICSALVNAFAGNPIAPYPILEVPPLAPSLETSVYVQTYTCIGLYFAICLAVVLVQIIKGRKKKERNRLAGDKPCS